MADADAVAAEPADIGIAEMNAVGKPGAVRKPAVSARYSSGRPPPGRPAATSHKHCPSRVPASLLKCFGLDFARIGLNGMHFIA